VDELDLQEERRAAQEEFARRDREALASRLSQLPVATECEDCGDPLTPIRQLYRWARCVECQTIAEKAAKHFRKKD